MERSRVAPPSVSVKRIFRLEEGRGTIEVVPSGSKSKANTYLWVGDGNGKYLGSMTAADARRLAKAILKEVGER